MTYPRITEGIRALTNPADHALLDACDAVDAIHASLEDENARLRSELDSVGTASYLYGRSDLKAENAKLIEIIADLEEMLPKSERLHIHKTANAIADDNSKLRQLVRDMYHVIATLEDANDEAVVRHGVMLDAAHFAKRVHELGLEVDG